MARCSLFASMMSAILFRMAARSFTGTFFQVAKTFQAASTAISTSSLVAWAQLASISPLAGQYVLKAAPSEASFHWPLMKSLYVSCSTGFCMVFSL